MSLNEKLKTLEHKPVAQELFVDKNQSVEDFWAANNIVGKEDKFVEY